MSTAHQSVKSRIVSLDQFRGYTVAGMLLVNFIGGFQAVGAIWKHHNTYCSYADTIMPQFFFAVGFALRLTFLRRLKTLGVWPATRAAVARNLGLILLGFVIYHLDGQVKSWEELQHLGLRGFLAQAFNRELFQTLVHIALASLWVLPVIAAGTTTRVAFLIASAALHLALSRWFYFQYAWGLPVIDGGPLGFLTWSIPLLVGSLAFDVVAGNPGKPDRSNPVPQLLAGSIVLMGMGYLLSCLGGSYAPPPFVEPPEGISVQPLDDEPAHRQRLVPDLRGGLLAGGLCPVRAALRPGQLASRVLSDLRSERPCGLHRASDGRRRGQTLHAG